MSSSTSSVQYKTITCRITMSVLILTAKDVEIVTRTLTTTFLCDLMSKVFTYLSSETSGANNPPRSSILTDNHNILFMPSRLHGTGTTIKIVSVPSSPDDRRGLPATTLILDDSTGAIKAVVNAKHLTALRNAGEYLVNGTPCLTLFDSSGLACR